MNIKIPIIIFLTLCILGGVVYGFKMYEGNRLDQISNEYSKTLERYETNKSIVTRYLRVYEIEDEATYQSVKNDIYMNLSPTLQGEIFPTTGYRGIEFHEITTELISCKGTNNTSGPDYFELKYRVKGTKYEEDIINLVEIKDGKIQNVLKIN